MSNKRKIEFGESKREKKYLPEPKSLEIIPEVMFGEIAKYLPRTTPFKQSSKSIQKLFTFEDERKKFEEKLPYLLIRPEDPRHESPVNNFNYFTIDPIYLDAMMDFWKAGKYLDYFSGIISELFVFTYNDTEILEFANKVRKFIKDTDYNKLNTTNKRELGLAIDNFYGNTNDNPNVFYVLIGPNKSDMPEFEYVATELIKLLNNNEIDYNLSYLEGIKKLKKREDEEHEDDEEYDIEEYNEIMNEIEEKFEDLKKQYKEIYNEDNIPKFIRKDGGEIPKWRKTNMGDSNIYEKCIMITEDDINELIERYNSEAECEDAKGYEPDEKTKDIYLNLAFQEVLDGAIATANIFLLDQILKYEASKYDLNIDVLFDVQEREKEINSKLFDYIYNKMIYYINKKPIDEYENDLIDNFAIFSIYHILMTEDIEKYEHIQTILPKVLFIRSRQLVITDNIFPKHIKDFWKRHGLIFKVKN